MKEIRSIPPNLSTPAPARVLLLASLLLPLLGLRSPASELDETTLAKTFSTTVRPFVETYCLTCHGHEKPKSDFDLSPYSNFESVVRDPAHWEMVLEKLQGAEMPPKKAKQHPAPELRQAVVDWILAQRRFEGARHAGDPGPVLARRLSNAEYDYTIHDLTGVDIRSTKEFPVDPANQAGFDNSGESLAMSPALLKKYLQAARAVAEHIVFEPEGLSFASHPVVADTDRDKYCVLRIVDFYKRQPTDYADYFLAAWRHRNRAAFERPEATLDEFAAEAKISPKYLALVGSALNGPAEKIGPIARLQTAWRSLPEGGPDAEAAARAGCEALRDWVMRLRVKLVPLVPNLKVRGMNDGSQTLVLWKDRQMAANRRRYDPEALQPATSDELRERAPGWIIDAVKTESATPTAPPSEPRRGTNRPPSTPKYINKGGFSLPPAILTTSHSATFQMAAAQAARRETDPDLLVPEDPVERARYEAAFARFADVFPDAFYISERARVYLDAGKEKENAGRLLSAGLHSMTGFFRDDQPLCDLILDEPGRRELDRLWQEFDFFAFVPQRMHSSFLWFERTDSTFMRDPEFDPYRPEDKSASEQAKIKAVGELYLAKAIRNGASETAQQAIKEHFEIVAANILRVEQERAAAESAQLQSLLDFASRAYRRPLSSAERDDLLAFYQESRKENGLDHEEAVRDCVARMLMSPNFFYRVDLIDDLAEQPASVLPTSQTARPLSDYSLASRLSYFLWSSQPDAELLALAAAGDLPDPEVLAAQARRMLQDPRARRLATEFGGQWLNFRRFEEHNAVDRERFPSFDNDLREAMFEEPIHFLTDLIRNDRSVLDLLYGDYTFVNAPLARHYGLEEPPPGEWVRVEHARNFQRGGLLPMSVFLTVNSPGLRTSPVKRGHWVVSRVLGERIPPPPPVVPELPADEKKLGDLTLRQALANHRENEACAGCHARFDSMGLVFEGYGPIGERRETDLGGRPVDIHADFPGGGEGAGLEGLLAYIHDRRENDFLENFCRKLVAYGLGRTLLPSDDSLLTEMNTKLAARGYRFSVLVETLVTSPQFRNKRIDTERIQRHAQR